MDLIALLPQLEQDFLTKDSFGNYEIAHGSDALVRLTRLCSLESPVPQDIELFLAHINQQYNTQTRQALAQRLAGFLSELLQLFFVSPTWADDNELHTDNIILNTFSGYWTLVSHLSFYEDFMPESIEQRDVLMGFLKRAKPYKLNLACQNLDGVNLSYLAVESPNFAHASLRRASLLYTHMPKAVFDNANLQYTQASNAHLPQSSWIGANLFQARFLGSELSKGMWHKANLLYADFSQANLSESYLDYSNAQATDFMLANLSKCHIFNSDLRFANFTKTNLSEANIENVDMRDTNLYGANFQYATIVEAMLQPKTWQKADFRHAILGERNQDFLAKQGAIV